MKIEMIVERTKTGYSAYSKKYRVYTVDLLAQYIKGIKKPSSVQTNSLEELKTNMLVKTIAENELIITLDSDNVFEFFRNEYMRYTVFDNGVMEDLQI